MREPVDRSRLRTDLTKPYGPISLQKRRKFAINVQFFFADVQPKGHNSKWTVYTLISLHHWTLYLRLIAILRSHIVYLQSNWFLRGTFHLHNNIFSAFAPKSGAYTRPAAFETTLDCCPLFAPFVYSTNAIAKSRLLFCTGADDSSIRRLFSFQIANRAPWRRKNLLRKRGLPRFYPAQLKCQRLFCRSNGHLLCGHNGHCWNHQCGWSDKAQIASQSHNATARSPFHFWLFSSNWGRYR